MLSPAAQASVLLASLAVFALCLYVAWRIWRPAPHAPRDRFRYVNVTDLADTGMCIRCDLAPGAPFALVCAGPGDTSPRAGYGHNVLADCGLQHTERAAWLAQELAPSVISALYAQRDRLAAELRGHPYGPVTHADVVRAVRDLGYPGDGRRVLSVVETVSGPLYAKRPGASDMPPEAFEGAARFAMGEYERMAAQDPDVIQGECKAGYCRTPRTCQQVGACADSVPTIDPRD